ncbi:DNA primase [Sphingobium boeckii]|uniref:DNA primase n=1 Tax=Sphingobium boeckii TaxID=1082345 RepID=A0A7W9EGM2_9SPHN|nr:DNA primase [Sphingobium boeckii]MBB5687245.1 DNA primase [Sphingobium boeckii]
MTLTPQFLDELRARTTLSTLIGKTVKVQRAGREFKACCPFHQEKTPSFTINDEKGFYHCFGCGAHGDAIRWMTDQRGLPFIDAVKELAQNAGMDVPAPDPKAAERAERASGLHEVMEAAAHWFEEQLGGLDGSQAREYLKKRGISDATRRAFGFGFSPDSKSKLKIALRDFGNAALIEAGLLIQPEEEGREPYGRFRGRLMIPIRDQRGRVIAFGGRILGAGEPKYLNSPDTPLFDKGRTLYNLDRASPAARKADRVLVVEGYMDVIALAQAGIEECVAPLGTALTEMQIERLWRMSDLPILCFDGDNAGQKAGIRAAERALPHLEPGRSLRFITLPQGQDPDDLVKSGGKAAMEALLAAPEGLADRLWRHEQAAEPLDTPEARAGLRRRLNEHAKAVKDPDVRDQYYNEFRNRFDDAYNQRRDFAPRAGQFPQKSGGFKKDRNGKWMPPDRPVSGSARAIQSEGIGPVLGKEILAGFLRYPAALAQCSDTLSVLAIGDPALDGLRGFLVDIAFRSQPLERDALGPILAEAGYGALASVLLKANRMRFSFSRDSDETGTALRDLKMAVEAIASRLELDAAISEATEQLSIMSDDGCFDEQVRLVAARNEANMRLAALTGGDDDAVA